MYDLPFFRSNLEAIASRLADRGYPLDVDAFRALDTERRAAVTEAEQLKAQRNSSSNEIAKLKREGVDTSEAQQRVRDMAERMTGLDERVKELDEKFRTMLASVPNVPHESVPAGSSAEDNVEVRRWGTPPQFDYEAKAHWDLGPALGILDMERAAKITGARFAVYWGMGARLERALINFMLDVHTREHGYTEVLPPFLINSASLYGTDRLPIRLTAYTPCFRSEAGSYGRDVRGIIRQHQFQKVELVKFARPEQSYEELEKLTADAEDILKRLGLPFRTVVLSTGDTGFSSAKTYDIEVWLPGQNGYKEISSCSNFEAFQARRAGIRMKSGKGKAEYVHTLNGSGLAVGRTWLAIVENYQQKDGSVAIPEALRPYVGAERIEPRSQPFSVSR